MCMLRVSVHFNIALRLLDFISQALKVYAICLYLFMFKMDSIVSFGDSRISL